MEFGFGLRLGLGLESEMSDHCRLCMTIGMPPRALLIAAMPDGKMAGSAVQFVTPPPPPPPVTLPSLG